MEAVNTLAKNKTKTAAEAGVQEKKTFAPLKAAVKSTPSEIENDRKELKFPRSRKYIKAITRTKDATWTKNDIEESTEEVVEALEDADTESMTMLKEQMKYVPLPNRMLGILSECGITGCIIHSIDIYGNIIEHYRSVAEIPEDIREGYLKWDQHPGRTMVEIYTHTLCFVYDDGSVEMEDRKNI
ncbi:hypothetical protein SAMN04487830_13910 [Pseudobutyrivibrio sp. OR37]|uniref:hypothetical protein n=1 Tax=Pseudobutyrivibrio sp. OR37 TaxID=1798186 RepID=UPI0008E72773|nr:hypothetical protein [Pseudobutyrivibrio sp. OR37]SFI29950.1 hypothetical protein SAMN04487830_13910 [Pseudobutyrivibrio sp. OR37]